LLSVYTRQKFLELKLSGLVLFVNFIIGRQGGFLFSENADIGADEDMQAVAESSGGAED